MFVSDFDYDLPERLIAQKPLSHRNDSRMMVVDRKSGRIRHSDFRSFPGHLQSQDLLVINTSRVIPTRLWGKIHEKEIEFLLLGEIESGTWKALCRPARKAKKDDVVLFSSGLEARIIETGQEGIRILQFSKKDVLKEIGKIGFAPLPPYIKRKKLDQKMRRFDLERYQTVYAGQGRSIAAPTAGLHFTSEILEEIKIKDVRIAEVILDVGLATFQPVRVERIKEHTMLEETFFISPDQAERINQAREEKKSLLAVGTTSVRALESAWDSRRVRSGTRTTSLFISPGFQFRVADKLLTNFHLPRSTLLMLVSAFAGHDLIMSAYREAVKKEYRFFSYGDCMLIE